MGLNCATGPQEMAEHVRWLAGNWPGLLSVQPNAGLPELVDGQTHYPLGAAELASWLERFVAEDGVNLIGGCCGTSIAAHRRAGRDAAQARAASSARRRWRASRCGCQRSPACIRRCRCARRTPFFASANAATPTARRNGASCRRSTTGTAASSMGREQIGEGSQRAGCLHRLRRPRRDARDERGDPPLHRFGERAAGDRQHGNAGDRGGAEAAWRQADHQLDQFRGWRDNTRPTG